MKQVSKKENPQVVALKKKLPSDWKGRLAAKIGKSKATVTRLVYDLRLDSPNWKYVQELIDEHREYVSRNKEELDKVIKQEAYGNSNQRGYKSAKSNG